MNIKGVYGEWYDAVYVDGELLDPEFSQLIHNHSPDGFAWGYGGSGPAQLALAIMLKATDINTATQLHQKFKWQFIASLPQREDFEFNVDIKAWADEQLGRTVNDLGQGASVPGEKAAD